MPEARTVQDSSTHGTLLFSTACEACPFPTVYFYKDAAATGSPLSAHGGGSTQFNERIEIDLAYSAAHAKDMYPADFKGRLIAATLPAGDYYIAKTSTWYRWGNTQWNFKLPQPIKVTVTADKVLYGGQFTLIFDRDKANNGFDLRIDDQFERDVALGQARVAALKDARVERRLFEFWR